MSKYFSLCYWNSFVTACLLRTRTVKVAKFLAPETVGQQIAMGFPSKCTSLQECRTIQDHLGMQDHVCSCKLGTLGEGFVVEEGESKAAIEMNSNSKLIKVGDTFNLL